MISDLMSWFIIFEAMLPVEKNKEIVDQIQRVTRRASNIREVKEKLFNFIKQVMGLNSIFSQQINLQMTLFEEQVMKNSLYYQKSNHIISLSKLYREFSTQIERNSKLNLISLDDIKKEPIERQDEKLRAKCKTCAEHFTLYADQEAEYNRTFTVYSQHCQQLGSVIKSYKTYQNPISFYNKGLTNDYLAQLEKKFQVCSTVETEIITSRQMLDQKRSFLNDHIKDVNENYFVLIHNYLVTLETIIRCIVYPKNEEKLDKTELNLQKQDNIEEQHNAELNRLDNLYATECNQRLSQTNPLQEFSELFRTSINQFEINSDYRFFHDRCQSIRAKKLKTAEETLKIQSLLVEELKQQLKSYEGYESQYRQAERQNFTVNGIQAYKKKFRKYFGPNFTEIAELCLNLIERQKKSLDKICKHMGDSEVKMKRVLDNKKQAISGFEKRSKIILADHLKQKEKVTNRSTIDSDELQRFKTNITTSFSELKKEFHELQRNEQEDDKLFYNSLKSLYEVVMREATAKNLHRLLEKEKNRIAILNTINTNHEIILILKDDTRYEKLLNECPKPNLYSTFVSSIPKREVEETRILLQKKEQRLKNMVRPKQGCCGITSELVKISPLTSHLCKLRTDKDKYKGTLNITSNGLIFEENTWFFEGLQLIIPQSDIKELERKTVDEREVVYIGTEFGPLYFESEENKKIEESMNTNLSFIGVKEPSEPGRWNNSNSSFTRHNTSQDTRLKFDRTGMSSDPNLSRILDNSRPEDRLDRPDKDNKDRKAPPKPKSIDQLLRDLVKKWKTADFFTEASFKRVEVKGDKRRDYQYQSGHSRFYLREQRDYHLVQKDLVLKYRWKVSFPESQMLHSFRHEQQVRLQSISKQLRIRISPSKYSQQQLYIKNKFYKQIEEMNKLLCQFIVFLLEKEAEIIYDQEWEEHKSLESFNIVLDDINLEERESRFEQNNLTRNSRIDKRNSSLSNNKP